MTARQVLLAVLSNEGADVAAHEMIRRALAEAESMERLVLEYRDPGHAGPGGALGLLVG